MYLIVTDSQKEDPGYFISLTKEDAEQIMEDLKKWVHKSANNSATMYATRERFNCDDELMGYRVDPRDIVDEYKQEDSINIEDLTISLFSKKNTSNFLISKNEQSIALSVVEANMFASRILHFCSSYQEKEFHELFNQGFPLNEEGLKGQFYNNPLKIEIKQYSQHYGHNKDIYISMSMEDAKALAKFILNWMAKL